MNLILWIVQIVLALAFLASGLIKLSQPKEKLAAQMAWVDDFSAGTIRLIGGLEVLAAIGLILPAATKVLPWLTPLAAFGLVLTMLGAAATHLRRNETPMIGINAILLLLAAFVVVGRLAVSA